MANTYYVTLSDLWARNLTATFSALTGEVTLKFEHRNPRLDSGTWKVYYDLSNGTSWTETTDFDNSSQSISTSSAWLEHSIVWNAFNDFPLTDNGVISIKAEVLDDDSVITSLTVTDFSLNLAPPEGDWKRPFDFGKDTTPTFNYYLPPLLRSQTVKPLMTIGDEEDFSGTNNTQQTFKVLSRFKGGFTATEDAGGGNTDIVVGTGHGLTSSDDLSLYDSDERDLNTTYEILSTTATKIRIVKAYTDTQVGKYVRPDDPVYGSAITEYDVVGGEHGRIEIQLESPFTMSSSETYYFKIDLRCENT